MGAAAPPTLVSGRHRREEALNATEQLELCAARAEALAPSSEAAREVLLFAAGLYREQARFAAALRGLSANLKEDLAKLPLAPLLDWLAAHGPEQLAFDARAEEDLPARLLAFWARGDREDYLSRALLRPYVQSLATTGVRPDRPRAERACPFCGGAPWVASRRSQSDGDGAARHLHCALCGTSWQVLRAVCPSCGESDPAKLPAYNTATHIGVRIESCENCRKYLKSIDLTLDARPIPEVDELLSLGMDLWAVEQGLERFEPGLAGL